MRDAENKTDSAFLNYTTNVSNEAIVKWKSPKAVPEVGKTDWYIYPFSAAKREPNGAQKNDTE